MDTLALILVIIGALNWGLVGLFQFDLVASLFGGMSGTFARIIYMPWGTNIKACRSMGHIAAVPS